MRCIVANLDCEAEFAETAGVSRYHLTEPVARRISALGTLLSVFGRADDTLWTPAPVDPRRLPTPHAPTLRSGAPTALAPASTAPNAHAGEPAVLAWGETERVAELRRASRRAGRDTSIAGAGPSAGFGATTDPSAGAEPGPTRAPDDVDWPAALWRLRPEPAVVARCNDRRFCFALQARHGYLLPGAAVLDSLAAVRAHLSEIGLRAGDAWVLEAPFAASGRLRVRRHGPALDRAIEARIERLLRRFGSLCFAPWVERVLDLGCLGVIEREGRWHIFPPHRLEVDRAGVFHGVTVAASPGAGGLPEPGRRLAREAAEHAARALAEAGYRGPFGIDGFAYRDGRDRAGAIRWQPMCEINARMSFGFVAHAWARRYPSHSIRLCVGEELPSGAPAGARIRPLLHPAEGDDVAAWLVLTPS